MAELPEAAFHLDQLLTEVTAAMATAARQLSDEFTTGRMREAPYMYHLPRMSCQIKLSLSYTREGVKGFFKKTKTAEEQEVVSTIELEIVAAPRIKAPT